MDSDGGMDEWGASPGVPSSTTPYAISATGTTIVGQRYNSTKNPPFRYSNGVYQDLGTAPSGTFAGPAYGVSGDGSTIVGALSRNGIGRAMRWTAATGIQDAGLAPGTFAGWFTGISRDGSTTIGIGAGNSGGFDAYTWTQSGGWRLLPVPSGIGTGYDAKPQNANDDGSLIAGYVSPFTGPGVAVVWRNGSPETLRTLGAGWDMSALALSDGGMVVGGSGVDPNTGVRSATVWLNGGGPVLLQDYLASLGVLVPTDRVLERIFGISSDGRTIVGTAKMRIGSLSEGFIVTIPEPGVALFGFVGILINGRRRRV